MSILRSRCTKKQRERERRERECESSRFAILLTIIISSDLTLQRLIFHIPETKTSHRVLEDAGAFDSIKFAVRLAKIEETRLGYHAYYMQLLYALDVKYYGILFSLAVGIENVISKLLYLLEIADFSAEAYNRGLFSDRNLKDYVAC